MKNYNKKRSYDGKNNDLGFQITYISQKKGKIKKLKYSRNVDICNYLMLENCFNFYSERVDNYKQMISDFTYFKNEFNTLYLPPLIIKKNTDFIFCHVKLDEIFNYRFLKFNFTLLSNELCFHDYIGNMDCYSSKIISSNNGYEFYINNKKRDFNNLKEAFMFYLKKEKMNSDSYSLDNVVLLTNRIDNIVVKYLGKNTLSNNLIKNNKLLLNLYGVYLSNRGNFLFLAKNCINFVDEYQKLIPTLENSYDLLKQYIMINKYLCEKYNNYLAFSRTSRQIKKEFLEICFFEKIKNNMLKDSMASVKLIINEFQKNCRNIDFGKKYIKIKKDIINELCKRNINFKSFVSDTTAKALGEIYSQTIDKLNGQ